MKVRGWARISQMPRYEWATTSTSGRMPRPEGALSPVPRWDGRTPCQTAPNLLGRPSSSSKKISWAVKDQLVRSRRLPRWRHPLRRSQRLPLFPPVPVGSSPQCNLELTSSDDDPHRAVSGSSKLHHHSSSAGFPRKQGDGSHHGPS